MMEFTSSIKLMGKEIGCAVSVTPKSAPPRYLIETAFPFSIETEVREIGGSRPPSALYVACGGIEAKLPNFAKCVLCLIACLNKGRGGRRGTPHPISGTDNPYEIF